jgi:Asp-tRNA(Asn)/Glu-tRNA(Gln) amidotransferase A subunit family amidase
MSTGEALRRGREDAEALTRACLERIAAREPEVQAWTFLDRDYALGQAGERQAQKRAGRPLGRLHGVPVGVKDIVDTADMPTENGTVLHAGRRPARDATVVSRLRAAGAVILGKTVTTELAVYTPGKTRNPRHTGHTPGGSSSGSAAAVADGMVPLAIGTQTNGSVIRPAAYCGCVGFKPSFGLIPRTGVLEQSRPLDHVGVFGADLEGAAVLAEVLAGHDPADAATRAEARPPLLDTLTADWPLAPDLAFVRTPAWGLAEPWLGEAFGELCEALGPRVTEIALPGGFDEALTLHATVMEADLALSFAREYERGRERLSARLVEMIERGQQVTAVAYRRALNAGAALRSSLEPLFARYDAIVTPATTGEAPAGLGATGSPAFCTIWTLLGMPAVTLPLLQGPSGLPLGVQLVGQWGDDARLLRTGRWLERAVVEARG